MDSNSNDSEAAQTGVGYLLVITAAVMFSVKAVFIKLAYRYQVDPTTLMTLRMLISAPIYAFILWRVGASQGLNYPKKTWLQIALLGLCGYYIASYLDLCGLQYISANLERLIIYLYPTMVIIISALVFKRYISRGQIVCMLLAYAGVAMVFSTDVSVAGSLADPALFSEIGIGTLLTLGSALAFSIYIAGSENPIRAVGSRAFTAIAMLAASVGIVLQFAFTHELEDLYQPGAVYALAAAIAFFSTVVPTLLMSEGINQIGANRAGLFGFIGPVATLLTAHLVLEEVITTLHIVAMLIILLSMFALTRLSQKTAGNSPAEQPQTTSEPELNPATQR